MKNRAWTAAAAFARLLTGIALYLANNDLDWRGMLGIFESIEQHLLNPEGKSLEYIALVASTAFLTRAKNKRRKMYAQDAGILEDKKA
ncbi:unnamed protein product [Danaus chrysippus]|uniref:(African queen) hypothetical protein n=1 Tax=Danaus chrysippus TaxID=151541 RepID=A0A8J2RK88_9NEOP|nr:unnamed protein product [Danaus chrysippus]